MRSFACGWSLARELRVVPGPTSKQDRVAAVECFLDSIPESHCVTQMLCPVLRIARISCENPRPRQIGHKRNLWLAHFDPAHTLGKRLQDRIHHDGMEGMGSVQNRGSFSLSRQGSRERRQSLPRGQTPRTAKGHSRWRAKVLREESSSAHLPASKPQAWSRVACSASVARAARPAQEHPPG